MKQRGFTLIELMVVITIFGILFAMALPIIMGTSSKDNSVSFGWNGVTEVRCIDGYKFVVGENGQARQMMDELGKGVRCQ